MSIASKKQDGPSHTLDQETAGLVVQISNYKSIKDTTLRLHRGLNILIGPNGSGKSCMLSALKFVRDVFRSGAAQALARSGGAKRVYHRGQHELRFAIFHPYGYRTVRRRKRPCSLSWQMSVAQSGPEQIATVVSEKVEITTELNGKPEVLFHFEVDRRTAGRNKIKIKGCDPSIAGLDLFSPTWGQEHKSKADVLPELQRNIRKRAAAARTLSDRAFFPQLADFDRVLGTVVQSFLFLNEYNILPEVARAATEPLPYAQMRPDGGSVSEVIHALLNRHYHRLNTPMYEYDDFFPNRIRFSGFGRRMMYHPVRYRRDDTDPKTILSRIDNELAAAVKPITGVGIQIDPTNGRRFVVFRAGTETFLPEEVSDGTMKWLCILVSILVPYSRVYLLEEPENFLHPWMQQRLIQVMRDRPASDDVIFVLTSHSATILNAALIEELILVRQVEGNTLVESVVNKEHIEKTLRESNFRLGDLWVSGALGGVPGDE